MAHEAWNFPYSFEAGEDLSESQYLFVKLVDGKIEVATAGDVVGVLQDAPGEGRWGSVVLMGITKVIAGDAIDAGEYLTSDNAGKGIPAVAGDKVAGLALSSAGGADILVTMLAIQGEFSAAS